MKINWKSFKSDPYFFFKYFFIQMLTSLLIFGALLNYKEEIHLMPQLHWSHFIFLPFALVIGVQLPAILHNAVHRNIKPLALNDIIGELVGFFVLFGLGPFRISHILHHAYADSESDTHPPHGKNFAWFLMTTQMNTIKVIRQKFLDQHGHHFKNHLILIVELFFYYISLLCRVGIWFLIFGPEFFLAFYLPAYIVNVLVFAHVNYATHATQDDGSVKIINLNNHWYYKLINNIGSGVYFHANHHHSPNLYNPMKES